MTMRHGGRRERGLAAQVLRTFTKRWVAVAGVLVAVKGHLPKAVKRSHPRELHLKAAHGKVFDVRKLKSVVVKKERPERTAPGYARPGSRAAEALENPTRTAPQLPKVLKRSQMVASAPA